jgi:hypothetical protein
VFKRLIFLVISIVLVGTMSVNGAQKKPHSMFVLDAGAFKHHVVFFNTMEPENIVNYISNARSWEWMREKLRADLLF